MEPPLAMLQDVSRGVRIQGWEHVVQQDQGAVAMVHGARQGHTLFLAWIFLGIWAINFGLSWDIMGLTIRFWMFLVILGIRWDGFLLG